MKAAISIGLSAALVLAGGFSPRVEAHASTCSHRHFTSGGVDNSACATGASCAGGTCVEQQRGRSIQCDCVT